MGHYIDLCSSSSQFWIWSDFFKVKKLSTVYMWTLDALWYSFQISNVLDSVSRQGPQLVTCGLAEGWSLVWRPLGWSPSREQLDEAKFWREAEEGFSSGAGVGIRPLLCIWAIQAHRSPVLAWEQSRSFWNNTSVRNRKWFMDGDTWCSVSLCCFWRSVT